MHPHVVSMVTAVSLLLLASGEQRKLIPQCAANACLTSPSPPLTCRCDSKCSQVFDDCCLDAPYRTLRPTARRHPELACVFVHGENDHFWMVDTCAEGWNDTQVVADKCHEAVGPVSGLTSDAPAGRPFTSPVRGLTYRNLYCGLCNGEDPGDLLEWRVKALCVDERVTPADVLSNLTYLEGRGQWGVWRGGTAFSPCHLLFQRPLAAEVRTCVSGMVSSCPAGASMGTRRKCKSYVDPVRGRSGPVFRNADCALCHGRNRTGLRCHHEVTRGSSAVMLDRAMHVDLGSAGQWLR